MNIRQQNNCDFVLNSLEISSRKYQATSNDNSNKIVISKRYNDNPYSVCPNCGCITHSVHERKERKILAPQFNFIKLQIYFMRMRFHCWKCNYIFIEPHDDVVLPHKKVFSKATKLIIKHIAKFPNINYKSLGLLLGVSSQTIINLIDNLNLKELSRNLPSVLLFDEFKFSRKQKDKYNFIVYDNDNNRVFNILKNRRTDELQKYFNSFSDKEKEKVKYVVIDCWRPYRQLAYKTFPNAKVVVDKFHALKMILNAFEEIRIKLQNQFKYNRPIHNSLKKNWKIFLKHFNSLENSQCLNYLTNEITSINQFINELENILPDEFKNLRKSYYFALDLFSSKLTFKEAEKSIDMLINELKLNKNRKTKEAINCFKNWKKEIAEAISLNETVHLSNGKIEGTNNYIKTLMRSAYGFRNQERFCKRILIKYHHNYFL